MDDRFLGNVKLIQKLLLIAKSINNRYGCFHYLSTLYDVTIVIYYLHCRLDCHLSFPVLCDDFLILGLSTNLDLSTMLCSKRWLKNRISRKPIFATKTDRSKLVDRSILQDFEREDDGCVLNTYPSAWVLNRTGG